MSDIIKKAEELIKNADIKKDSDKYSLEELEKRIKKLQEGKKEGYTNRKILPKGSIGESYSTAISLIRDIKKEKSPQDLKLIEKISKNDIIVIEGVHDKIEDVLNMLDLPYTIKHPNELYFKFNPEQILFINCPGGIDHNSLNNIKNYVFNGGHLVTSDWTLESVLEIIFPEKIRRYSEIDTNDDVVKIEFPNEEGRRLVGADYIKGEARWWLESNSYPIEIVDKNNVRVLVTSREMGQKYGKPHIVVTFDYGRGKVTHAVSHFYLQRTETNDSSVPSCFTNAHMIYTLILDHMRKRI